MAKLIVDETRVIDKNGYFVVGTGLYLLPNGDYMMRIVSAHDNIGREWPEEMTGPITELSGHLGDLYRFLGNDLLGVGPVSMVTVTERYA